MKHGYNNSNIVIHLTTKKLLIVILSLQLAFLGLVGLEKLGLEIPILRQAVGFIYLTFVPGFLIFKLLQINNKNAIESLLYSVGLSLSFLMFTGALINSLYPIIGISKPISEIPLLVTISVIIIFLFFICYLRDKGFSMPFSINTKQAFAPSVLSLLLIAFLAVFGAYLLNFHNNNLLLLIIITIISILPLFVAFDKISEKMYPVVVWIISISLLLSITLSMQYLSGGDAEIEYYYANLVQTKGVWDPSIAGNMNAMLRIVILHPIHSILLNMELTDVFRVIHPLLYSFTPVALYVAFKRQTNEKIAFLSSFFFMSIFSFHQIFSRNTRTGIAELFLALFILLMTDRNMNNMKKTLLSIIFSLSIVVSHYGTSYLFMLSLFSAALLSILIRKYRNRDLSMEKDISLNLTLLYTVFCLTWYIYNADTSPFRAFVFFFDHMISQISELFTPETSYIVYALSREWAFSVRVSRDLLLITTILIAIGIISLIWNTVRKKEIEFQDVFVTFSIVYFGILLATFLPTKSFNPARVYHICLCFLAPLSVIGFIKLCNSFKKIKEFRDDSSNENSLKIFSVFLMIILLFHSGFVSEVVTKGDDYSPNIVISKPRALDIKNDAQYIYSSHGVFLSDQEVFSAKWLSQKMDESVKIYLDCSWGFLYFIGPSAKSLPCVFVTNRTKIKNGYILLNTYNIARNVSIIRRYPPEMENINEVYPINLSNKIYTNGGSEIYYR